MGVCSEEEIDYVGITETMGGVYYFSGNVSLTSMTTISVDPAIGYLEIHAGGDITIDETSGIFANAIVCGPRNGSSSNGYSMGGGSGAGHYSSGGSTKYYYDYNNKYKTLSGASSIPSINILDYNIGSCGGSNYVGTAGGKGGGAIVLYANNIDLDGTLQANAAAGVSSQYGGSGGGSGGSVILYGGTIDVASTADISASGGSGGTASYSSSYSGGAGSVGMIKILSGQLSAMIVDGSASISSQNIKTVAPSELMSSSTHPDETKWYNDGFTDAMVSWNRPTYLDVAAYFYKVNQTQVSVPASGNGIYTVDNATILDSTDFSAGTNFFHLVTQDFNAQTGTVENNFKININTAPPTITSSSHSSQTTFYDAAVVGLNWTDPSGKAGSFPYYKYIWDMYADTTPGLSAGVQTDNKDLTQTGVPDGIWYLHVISLDTMGYPTKTARHFKVNVGLEPGKGNVAGIVKASGTNDPIGNATVKINGGIWTTATDGSSGAYSFGDETIYSNTEYSWPKWEVSVEAPGYKKSVQSIDVTADESTPLHFFLESE